MDTSTPTVPTLPPSLRPLIEAGRDARLVPPTAMAQAIQYAYDRHAPTTDTPPQCTECTQSWPCPTVTGMSQIIGGAL